MVKINNMRLNDLIYNLEECLEDINFAIEKLEATDENVMMLRMINNSIRCGIASIFTNCEDYLGMILKKNGVGVTDKSLRDCLRIPDINSPSVNPSTGYYPSSYYPCEFYLLGARGFDYEVTHQNILDFFENRAMDKNREGIDEYLYSLGLSEWDGWEICRRTKAINFEDFHWITQDENEDYREVLARW